jgi:hypothetical protein
MNPFFACFASSKEVEELSPAHDDTSEEHLPPRELIVVRPAANTETTHDAFDALIVQDWNRELRGSSTDDEEIKPTAEEEAQRGIDEAMARVAARRKFERHRLTQAPGKAKTLQHLFDENNNPDESDEDHCVICLDAAPSRICVPCGHQCLCSGCSKHFEGWGPGGVRVRKPCRCHCSRRKQK